MSNSQIASIPFTSDIQVTVEFLTLSELEKLVNKYREKLKLPERPLDFNTLFNAKLVALLTEEDPTLSPIEKTLQSKIDKTNANSHYFHLFTRDLHGYDGLLNMDGKLVILLPLKNMFMTTLY